MKRILVLGAGIAAVVVVGIAGAAGSPSSGLDRKGAAQQILKVHGKYLTAPAQAALRMVANGDRQLAAPPQAIRGGGRSGGLAAGPAAPFTNVRVNDPAADSHQVDQTTQSETSVTVAGSKVAVGYNDSQRTGLFLTAGSSISGYSYSTDGGASFTDGGALPNAPEVVNLGDPWLTSDRAGNMYYSTLANDAVNLNLDVAVAKSTDGGRTWSDPVPVTRPPIDIFYSGDKDAMAVGPNPSRPARDNIYVAYDDFSFDFNTGAFNIGLPVARSTDGGATWQISYADRFDGNAFPGCSFAQYIGAVPIVASDGTLYVALRRSPRTTPTARGSSRPSASGSSSRPTVDRHSDPGFTFPTSRRPSRTGCSNSGPGSTCGTSSSRPSRSWEARSTSPGMTARAGTATSGSQSRPTAGRPGRCRRRRRARTTSFSPR